MLHETDIERVSKIHAVLDRAGPLVAKFPEIVEVWSDGTRGGEVRCVLSNGQSTYGDECSVRSALSGTHHSVCYPNAVRFTADEVRAWPTVKRALTAELVNGALSLEFAIWCDWWSPPGANLYQQRQEHRNAERGLCMYRKQLGAVQCAACGHPHATFACGNGDSICRHCQESRPWSNVRRDIEARKQVFARQVRNDDERTGPVNGGSDLSHELAIFERQKAEDEASGRRARLVAALSAEMSRPVEPRFPPEGRSDRVFGGRRR
jgi:hypothetical protein